MSIRLSAMLAILLIVSGALNAIHAAAEHNLGAAVPFLV